MIEYHRDAAHNLKEQADRMLRQTQAKLRKKFFLGTAFLKIPVFDKAAGKPSNIIGVILVENAYNKFKIGTEVGIIDSWLERTGFEAVNYRGLTEADVPKNIASIREIARELTIGTSTGIKKCSCRTTCTTKKCKCFKSGMRCTSYV